VSAASDNLRSSAAGRSNINLLSDIWAVLTPRQRRWVLAAQILSFAMAISTVTGIAAIAPFFSVLGKPQLIDTVGLLHWLYVHLGFASQRSFIVALGLAFLALVLVANLINILGAFALSRLASWIGTDLQSALFAEYLSRPYLFHTRTHSATLFNNIVNEPARTTYDILQNVLTLTTNAVTAALILLSVALLSPAVAVAMIAVLAGGYVLIYLVVRNRLLRCGHVQTQFFREQAKIVKESLGAIREIILLRNQAFFRDNFERASRGAARAIAYAQLVGQSSRHVMECVAVAGLIGLALFLGGGEDNAGPWLGRLTFLGFAAYRLLPTLQQAFAAIVKIGASRAGFSSITADLRLARAREAAVIVAANSCWEQCPRQEIRLNEVFFGYAPDRPLALSGVSLSIPAKGVVGFVGANGSGKTTLVDLIAGLFVPTAGQVEVDGVALDDTNRIAWQSRIAYVPQTIFLLDATIAQNIALGSSEAAIDRERLLEAARLAQLDEFVGKLPDGYDHIVGERGSSLSGGQRQRIGIARALYVNASVLILDEATTALDGLREQELMATLERLRGRYTIILIAHNSRTVRMCDVIFELERGKLSRTGTYDVLMKDSAMFRRMSEARG
jgi:ATP-binding cassette, subfamily B, bacterial PglK